jgi:hypothetical protein
MNFFESDPYLNKEASVILEPNPTPYNGTSTYVKMYSGSPYPLGLDPVCLFYLFLKINIIY